MKKTILAVSMLLASAFATQAVAEEGRGSVGLGSYAWTLSASAEPTDLTFSGSALTASYDVTGLVTVAGHYYFLKNDVNSIIELNGLDVMVRAGKNDLGFSYFGAVGFYSETMEAPSVNSVTVDYSGGLIGYGIGYNWQNVALTWEGSLRSTGDYEKNSPNSGSIIAATGSLNVAYRF